MDIPRLTFRRRWWLYSASAALLAIVSTHALAVGQTPSAELLNPQYIEKTSSFTFTLLNREKNPREYQFESQLYSQGRLLKTFKHDIWPEFDANNSKEKSNFALSSTLSIPVLQVAPGENGIYSLRVIAYSRDETGDVETARMWIRFQQRDRQIRFLTQREYTNLIHRPDKSGDLRFSAPNRDGFGKADPQNASFMLPILIEAEKAPIVGNDDKPVAPVVEQRSKRPSGVVDIREFANTLRIRDIAMQQMRPSVEREGVFVPAYEPLQTNARTEINE